jgi:hypothetical protein
MGHEFSRRKFLKNSPLVGSGLYGALSQTGAAAEKAQNAEPDSVPPAKVEELTSIEDPFADAPVIASNGEGTAWAAWLSRLNNDKETITVRRYHGGTWSRPFGAVRAEAGYESLRLACAPSGEPLAIWIKTMGNEWSLEAAKCTEEEFGSPAQIGAGTGRPSNPVLIAGKAGMFWVAWEAYHGGRFSIHLAVYRNGVWGKPVNVSGNGANSYSPALSIDPKTGLIWVAYSALTETSELAVALTSYDPESKRVGKVQEIARGGYLKRRPNFNTYPAVHCDAEGRVWIAYEHDSNRSLRSESMRPSGGTAGNHWGTRECRVVCYRDGHLLQVTPADERLAGDRVLTDHNDHYPTFIEDAESRLWLFSRDSSPLRRAWTVRGCRLDGGQGWTEPTNLLGSFRMGRLSRPAVAVKDKDSLWLVWQADNVLGKAGPATGSGKINLHWGPMEDDIPGKIGISPMTSYDSVTLRSGIFAMQVPFSAGHSVEPLRLEAASAPAQGSIFPAVPYSSPRGHQPRRKVTVNGKEYTLLYGNLHEHSLISRCWDGGDDGTPDDDYRYGRDIEGYDFSALTDHCYDLYQMKWREVRRAASFYNDPPHFVALPAYEWTRTMYKDGVFPGNGHRNIIFANEEDAARFVSSGGTVYSAFHQDSDSPRKVWELLRAKGITEAVTIPHHSADSSHPTTWDDHDETYETLVEMFQCRQSQEYEGCPRQAPFTTMYNQSYVQDALRRGYRLGFIASGDHQNMGEGLAAVLVLEVSRAGIVEALRARRCYGTTGDKIFVDFRVDGHFMGQELTSPLPSEIQLAVDGTDALSSVTVFCNGQVVMEKKEESLGGEKNIQLRFTDKTRGSRYYYLRAQQRNGEIAWSSPVWVNA